MKTEFIAYGTELSKVDYAEVPRCNEWRIGDQHMLVADAECLYRSLRTKPRRVLDYWLDNEVRTYKAVDMVRELGLKSPRSLSGATSCYTTNGRNCGSRGLQFHWNRTIEDGTFYWMEQGIRDLFIAARERCRQSKIKIAD
jgi:hypothetical protein